MIRKSMVLVVLMITGFISFVAYNDISAEGTGLLITSTELEYITPDTDFSIDIIANDAMDLVGFQTKFLFDTSKFTLVSIMDSENLGNQMTVNDTVPGEITLNYVDVNAPLSGTQVLFTLTFHASSTILYEDVDVVTEDATYMHQFITIDELYNIIPVDVVSFQLDQVKRGYIGDANLDGYVNIIDAAIMQLVIANLSTLSEQEAYFADVNQDGYVSVIDVAKVQLYVSGIIDTLEPDAPQNIVYNYANGVYDLTKVSAADKGLLFAAAERYLLENVYGGVPLYTSARRVMYADRVELFSPVSNGVLGFGEEFSTLQEDDSNVFMYDAVYGNAGEYTWRDSFRTDPVGLNAYTVDDSSTIDFVEKFTGKLYSFYFANDLANFDIKPDLASADPIPVNPVVVNNRVYATTWEIPLRTDLTWSYHPNTDTSVLPANHEILDANDYLWTWQKALDNQWFRAIAGGNDFITQGIVNAQEYTDGTANWQDVGLQAINDHTIRLEFNTDKSMFDVQYIFTNTGWSPINQELYEYLEGTGGDAYGTTPETVASSGVYIFEGWTQGQFLFFAKNPNHPHAEDYHYTGQQFRYIETDEQRFEEFLAGRLERSSVPSVRVTEFITDPRMYQSPDATTWRLMINSFGTEANRDEYIATHPDTAISQDYVPEPILQYVEMRQALYYGFDRYDAAVNVAQTYLPAFALFTDQYFLDAEGGISVRGTDAGQAILDDFGMGTYGYDPATALDLFKAAVDQGITDGFYTPGTPEAYTEITLSLFFASSGNVGAQTMVAELKQQYEALLVDDTNYVRLIIEVNDVSFPGNYYDYMMVANTDLGVGGISGSLLDAPGFLDVYQDDNISGFTLNWGIDTHTPNIEVSYRNENGILVHEIWSYNALAQALSRRLYIRDGIIQSIFNSTNELIDGYLDMEGTTRVSDTDGATIAQYILGDTLENLRVANNLDGLYARIVITGDGQDILFVVQEKDGNFELFADGIYPLYTDAETAIENHSGYPSYYVSATGPMSDADVVANAYLTSLGNGFTTVAEYAGMVGSPEAYTELYATDWDGWSDVYVVLHIDQYYIGWVWL